MAKCFPKGQTMTEEDQYRALLEELAGNDSFALLRQMRINRVNPMQTGKVSPFLHLIGAVEETISPAAFLKQWQDENAASQVIGNLMAQLKRDGFSFALEAIKMSLTNGIPLPGEEFEISAKTTLTFIMPEAEKVMALIRLAHHFHYQQKELRDYCKRIKYNPAEILAKYPEFVKKVRATRIFGQAIFDNLDDWADAFCKYEYRNILFPLIKDELVKIFVPYYETHSDRLGKTDLHIVGHSRLGRVENPIDSMPIVLAVYGQPKQIKSQFSRRQQEKMAVWPVEIPTHMLKYVLGFGNELQRTAFMPEKEAANFQNFGWMSRSFQQGYGLWIGGNILSPYSYPSTFKPYDHKAIDFELKIWSHSINQIMDAEKAK